MDLKIQHAKDFDNWQDSHEHLIKLYQATNDIVLDLIKSIKMSNANLIDFANDNEKKLETFKKFQLGQIDIIGKFTNEINVGITGLSNRILELSSMFESHTKLLDMLGKGLKGAFDEINKLNDKIEKIENKNSA